VSPEAVRAVLGLLGAYLLASVPFGVLVARATARGDLRASGSGNIGATNVLRTAGAVPAAATLVLDMLKGFLALGMARALGPEPVPGDPLAPGSVYLTAAMVLPVAGHCFPPWLRFRGGKGVATALGVLLAAWWPGAVVGLAVFAVVVAVTRIVSLGSLLAAGALPVTLAVSAQVRGLYLPGGLIIAALIALRHQDNIRRLVSGTENRLGSGNSR
jgi:glycerol-3-phosphate acyltransferase PlsY